MLVRWLQGRAVFTEQDWLLLFAIPVINSSRCALAPVRRPVLGCGGDWLWPGPLRLALLGWRGLWFKGERPPRFKL